MISPPIVVSLMCFQVIQGSSFRLSRGGVDGRGLLSIRDIESAVPP